MRGIAGLDPGWGITAVRIAVAIILIVHGYQKWFQFGVTTGVAGLFAKFGLPMPGLLAFVAATLELGGGILLLIGLFTRWVGLLVAIQFVVATFYVQFRLRGYMAGELEMMLLAGGLLLFLAGSGRAAVDESRMAKR
jgi:putative oxidoreductase